MGDIPDLLDLREAALKLRMAPETLAQLRRERGWPCVRRGAARNAKIFFTPDQVRRILDDLTEHQAKSA